MVLSFGPAVSLEAVVLLDEQVVVLLIDASGYQSQGDPVSL